MTPKFISRSDPAAIWTRRCGSCGRRGEAEFRRALEIARVAGRDLVANPERAPDKSNGEGPNETNAEISRAGRFSRVS